MLAKPQLPNHVWIFDLLHVGNRNIFAEFLLSTVNKKVARKFPSFLLSAGYELRPHWIEIYMWILLIMSYGSPTSYHVRIRPLN